MLLRLAERNFFDLSGLKIQTSGTRRRAGLADRDINNPKVISSLVTFTTLLLRSHKNVLAPTEFTLRNNFKNAQIVTTVYFGGATCSGAVSDIRLDPKFQPRL